MGFKDIIRHSLTISVLGMLASSAILQHYTYILPRKFLSKNQKVVNYEVSWLVRYQDALRKWWKLWCLLQEDSCMLLKEKLYATRNKGGDSWEKWIHFNIVSVILKSKVWKRNYWEKLTSNFRIGSAWHLLITEDRKEEGSCLHGKWSTTDNLEWDG